MKIQNSLCWTWTDSCPTMSAGPTYEWAWADGESEPRKLHAREYFKTCLLWADSKISDPKLFPVGTVHQHHV